jgi:hypothetical protein
MKSLKWKIQNGKDLSLEFAFFILHFAVQFGAFLKVLN